MKLADLKELNGYLYLATPYSKWPDGIASAFLAAAELASNFVKAGVGVYSPIVHTHPIAIQGGIDPLSHAIWMPADKFLAEASKGLVVATFDGWKDSVGIGEEVEWFKAAGKPVFFLDPQHLELTAYVYA